MESMELIQEEAKKRYPIGCYYISATDDDLVIRKLKKIQIPIGNLIQI